MQVKAWLSASFWILGPDDVYTDSYAGEDYGG